MTYKTLLYSTLMFSFCLMTSCNDDDDSTLNIATTEMVFDHIGGVQTLTIDCNDDWSIYGLPEWIEASSSSGINSQTVTFTASENTTGLDREQLLTIRTNDSKNMHTISVRQYAYEGGPVFTIDDTSLRYFNGSYQGYENYIDITSSSKWIITGPDWIRMSFDGKQSAMNGELRAGSGTIRLSVYMSNDSQDMREDTITIRKYDSDEVFTIPVVQLGLYDVMCVNLYVLSDVVWTDFKFGSKNIQYIQCGIEEGVKTAEEMADKTWNYVGKGTTRYFSNLKPDTDYTICMRGKKTTTSYYKKVNVEVIHTPTDVNQPRALIEDVEFRDGKYYFSTKMNQYAAAYWTYEVSGISHSKAWYVEDFYWTDNAKRHTTNKNWSLSNTNRTVLTWAEDQYGYVSDVVDMYQFSYIGSSSAPVWQQTPQIEHLGTINAESAASKWHMPLFNIRNRK